MGKKVNGSNNFPCESAVIQANIKPDPSTEVAASPAEEPNTVERGSCFVVDSRTA